MSEETALSTKSLVPCLLGWLVPGAGHLLLGRLRRGTIFIVCIPLLFGAGLYLNGNFTDIDPAHPLTFLARFANLGVGFLYFLTRFIGGGQGNILDPTYEYGWTFMVVAGLLNYLVVLDVYDIATGAKA